MTPLTLSGYVYLAVLLSFALDNAIDVVRYAVFSHAAIAAVTADMMPLLPTLVKMRRDIFNRVVAMSFMIAYLVWLVSP